MVQEQLTYQICKHWYRGQKQVRLPNRGLCLLTTSAANDKPDGAITIGNNEQSTAVATASVIAPFGGGIVTAGLETKPDFGCNQHEVKCNI